MTDTMTTTRERYVRANVEHASSGRRIFGVLDREANTFDPVWASDATPMIEGRDATLATARAQGRMRVGYPLAQHYDPSTLVIEDDEPERVADPAEVETTREAQAQALATMRRRERDALAAQAAAELQRDMARNNQRAAEERANQLGGVIEDIADKLLTEADRQGWCSRYEEWIAENNFGDYLYGRQAGYVTFDVTLPVRVHVDNIRDYDIGEEEIKEAIYGLNRWQMSIDDYTEIDTEIE